MLRMLNRGSVSGRSQRADYAALALSRRHRRSLHELAPVISVLPVIRP